MSNDLRTRVISGVLVASISGFFLYIRGPLVIVIALFYSISGVVEFNLAYRRVGYKPMPVISGLLAAVIVTFFTFYNSYDVRMALLVGYAIFFVMIAYQVISDYDFIDVIITFFSVIYVAIPISFIIELSKRPDNFMWLVFLLAIITDIFAYLVGKTFGKNKLIEEISPKKTIEGAIGGVVGCVLTSLLFSKFFLPQVNLLQMILLSIIGSIASQVGDLTASKIKRYCGIKDFSNIIPGHGGILDRLDSILFTATIVYIFVWAYF